MRALAGLKGRGLFALSLAAIVAVTAVLLIAPRHGTLKTADESPGATVDGDVRIVRTAQGAAYQILTGNRARARLAELETTHKKFGFRRAARNLQKRGLVPTTEVTVFRRFPDGEIHIGEPTTAAQTSISDGSGEVLFWSWDDGDDSTWEGTLYAERYSDGMYTTWDMQLDISSTTEWVDGDWTSLDDFGDADEGGGNGGPIEVALDRKMEMRRRNIAVPIAWTPPSELMKQCPSYGCMMWQRLLAWYNAVHSTLRARAREYARCIIPAEIGVGVACAWTGWGFPTCMRNWGSGAAAMCGVKQLVDHVLEDDPPQ